MDDFYFSSDVDDESVNTLLNTLTKAADEGETTTRVFLQTCGGDLNAAFAAYDRLRLLQREQDITIEMVAAGYCLSAGMVLLQAGTKRYATPHTIMMLHQPEQYGWGESKDSIQPDELHGRLQLHMVTRSLLANIFSTHTGTDEEEWSDRLRQMPTHFFDVQTALADRLIDAVLPVD